MATKFNMTRDINGYNGYGLSFSDNKYSAILTAGSEDTVMVPMSPFADYKNMMAIFSFAPGSSVWVSVNETAAAPAGSFSTTASEMNPEARRLKGGEVLHFITNDASDEVGVTFYAIY